MSKYLGLEKQMRIGFVIVGLLMLAWLGFAAIYAMDLHVVAEPFPRICGDCSGEWRPE